MSHDEYGARDPLFRECRRCHLGVAATDAMVTKPRPAICMYTYTSLGEHRHPEARWRTLLVQLYPANQAEGKPTSIASK